MLFPWFVRRVYYVLNKPQYAALTSVAYAMLLFSLLALFRSTIFQRTETIYLIMAFSGFTASLSFFLVVRGGEKHNAAHLNEIIKQNWKFGKWIILTGFLVSIAHQMPILFIGSARGLEEAGILRALHNFIQPMMVIITAISMLFLPIFSAQFKKLGASGLKKNGVIITSVVFIMSVVYGLFLWIFRFQLEQLFYGGKYHDYVDLIPLFSLVPMLMALTIGASVILKAIQKPQAIFVVSIGKLITSIVISLVFITRWGLIGAVWSAVITQAVATLLILIILLRRFRFSAYSN